MANNLTNNFIPEGWEIEEEHTTNNLMQNNSIAEIPEGWEIESNGMDSDAQNEQPEMRETFITSAPKYNLIDEFKKTLNWVNNARLSAYQEGKNNTRIADLETKEMFGRISDDEKSELNILSNLQPIEYGVDKPKDFKKKEYQNTISTYIPKAKTFLKKGYVESLRMIPLMWETIKAGGAGGVAGGVIGAGAGAVTSAATTKANIVPATIQGAKAGFGIGTKIAGSTKVAQLEAGLARNELKKINQEIIEKGGEQLSDAEINTLSIMAGTINGALEIVSLKSILKTVPNGNKIIDYLEKGAIREVVQDKTIREQIKKITKDYGQAILTETATEMLQETTNIVAERAARGLGKIDQSPLSEDVQRIIETGVSTLGATMFLGGATSGSKVATIYAKQELDKLNAELEDKTYRAKQIASEYVGQMPEPIKKTLYSADAQVKKIKEKAKEFANSLTPEQQAQYVEDNFDTLVSTVNDLPSVQEIENEEKLNEFKNTVYEKLLKGNVSKDVALAEATLFANNYKKFGEAGRQKFEEMLNRLEVEYNIPAEQRGMSNVYQQPNKDFAGIAGANENEVEDAQREWEEKGTESKYFKNWFGDSKVIDEGGKPLVVYHGTNVEFDTFEIDYPAYAAGNFKGAYFVDNVREAKDYGNNVKAVYVKIENPLIGNPYEEYAKAKGFDYRENFFNIKKADVEDWIKEKGFDGIIRPKGSQYNLNGTEVIPFSAKQIKSVDNRGTFDAENPNIFYQFIGEQGAANLETGAIEMLKEAKRMEKAGESQQAILKQTGWLKGVDKKWKYEISDKDAEFTELFDRAIKADDIYQEYVKNNLELIRKQDNLIADREVINDKLAELYKILDLENGQEQLTKEQIEAQKEFNKLQKEYTKITDKLDEISQERTELRREVNKKLEGTQFVKVGDILKHDKLYAAYPEIKTMELTFREIDGNELGYISGFEIVISKSVDKDKALEVLMHEIQHYIQDKEGFARGGSPSQIRRLFDRAINKIENSSDLAEYEELMKEYSIVNDALLVHSITNKPENVAKSYWWLQTGKGWYAPRKTRKKARKEYIDKCCEELLIYLSEKNSAKGTEIEYQEYVMKDTKQLRNKANALQRKAWNKLSKVDIKTQEKLKSALKKIDEHEISPEYLYFRLAGEVEARATEKRIDLNEAQRRGERFNPYNTTFKGYDIKPEEQYIIFGNGDSISYSGSYQNVFNNIANAADTINTIVTRNKISELAKKYDFIRQFGEVLNFAQDYYIDDMPKRMKRDGLKGRHKAKNKIIYINFEAVGDDFVKFIGTLAHEAEHARQEKQFQFVNSKKVKTAKDKAIIENYNNCKKANDAYQKHCKEHKDLIDSIEKNIKYLKEHERDEFLLYLPKEQYLIYTENKILYNNYYNQPNEIKAREASKYAVQKAQSFDERRIRELQAAFRGFRQRTIRTAIRSSLQGFEGRSAGELAENEGSNSQRLNNILFQPAYHGTPHKFDEFSLDAIGTGEGAQAHGWGLYFAGNKEVSEDYRKKLTQAYGGMYHDLYLYKTPDNKQAIIEYKKEPVRTDIDEDGYLDLFYQIKTNGKEKAKKYLEENNYPDYVIEDINNINPDDINIVYADDINGQLYEVDIPENDVLLDEQEMLIDQSEFVQEAIEKANKELGLNIVDSGIRGGAIYDKITDKLGSQKEASLYLNKLGIKGITYDGRQDGRCYVIFDDKAVKVLNTFYQGNQEESELIAGYTPAEVLAKSQEIWDSLGDINNPVSEEEAAKMIARANMLEDVIYASANQSEYNPQQLEDMYLNAYYIMNDQEIPEQILEEEVKSSRNYADLRDLHNKKKEQAEFEYRGYFESGQDKDIITIMSNQDASTALHELGHWYLKALNEMAKVDEVAQKQLDEVDKWLGRSGDYTVSQQEKFAASFEAYLYQGKAPNKELKGVFENFKQWLQSIKNYAEDVLGRGAEISKEVNEMFDRMFANDEYYNERKQARELLNRVRKSTRKERARNNIADDRELDEVEKRHKDVSYEILSAATGKSVKYLKTIFETKSENETQAKKREAIINDLDKVEDKITISGGMREEWKEFYSDTGVDYETSESGADYELASQALDTIINKAYRNISKDYESEMSYRAEYFEREISKADKEYTELLRSYKKENRNVALAAIYDWMDSLDTNIKQDYEDRFIYDSRIIERNENLDKFDKAKRQIIARALQVENKYGLPKDEKYKEVVKEIMKNLNFLQAEDKARLTANILDVQGVDMLMGRIDSIMDIAKTMEDVNYRRNLQREIHKELQGTKNQKKGARVVGKYDYRTNKIFEKLREYDKLTTEKARELLHDMQKLMSAEENGLSYRDKLFNKFLSYKANGMIYADTDLMKDIYDEIVRIKLAGKTAKNEIELEEKLDQSKEVERLVKIIESKFDNKEAKKDSKGKEKPAKANIFLKGYITGFSNLESVLNALFNKKVAQEYGAEILYAETQADVMQYEIKDKFEKEVAKIYELPEWDWDRQIIKYLGEKFEFNEIRRKYDPETFELIKSKTVKKEMTKMDLILAYMWSMNETLNKRLINMFGEAQLEAMFDELSLQDVKLAELMLRTAQSTYPMANKAYIKKYGLDLPKVNAYFPSKVERGTEIDLFNDYSSKTLNNAFTKTRTTSELIPMEFSNPVQILYNHIDGVAKFVNMVEHLDKANAVLNNKEFLKPVIIEKFGEGVYKTLTQILLNTTYKTQSQVYNGIQKIFDYVSSNWIVANISTRPIVALKQLLSANNYATEMPVGDWTKGFVNCLLDYKNSIDYMMKIPYVKARLGASMQNEFLKRYIENSAFARTKKLKDFLAMNVKLGDAGSLIFGGKPYIDYLISQGVSESEAIKQFVLQTNRTQQSSAVSSLSNFQVWASRQPIGSVLTAYRNAQQQYVRKCGDAIIAYSNGDIDLRQCAKTVFHYMFLQPYMFNLATSGSLIIWATSGDDEEFWADTKLSLFNLCMDSVGLLSETYNYVLRLLVENENYRPMNTPLWGDIQREIGRIAKEDAEIDDIISGLGYILGNIGTGIPVPAMVNMGAGVKDMITDDFLKGMFRLLGYSEKRAGKMSGKE